MIPSACPADPEALGHRRLDAAYGGGGYRDGG
jgi:hypothetical protein